MTSRTDGPEYESTITRPTTLSSKLVLLTVARVLVGYSEHIASDACRDWPRAVREEVLGDVQALIARFDANGGPSTVSLTAPQTLTVLWAMRHAAHGIEQVIATLEKGGG